MREITEATAKDQIRDLFNKGFTAIERRNYDYAVDLLMECVEKEPDFLQARKFLRAAGIRRFLAKEGNLQLRHVMAFIICLPELAKYFLSPYSKKPLAALLSAERLMSHDPLHPFFIRCLCKAAEAAESPEIAIQTLTMVRDNIELPSSMLFWLGQLYLKTGQTKSALECFEELNNANPNDAVVLKALKDTMALNSMNRDGWESAARDGFRSAIKDLKESELIERESKAVKNESDIEALIAENRAKIDKEPGNVNYRRSLSTLLSNAGRFDEAIAVLEETQALTATRDPQLDNSIMQIRLRQFDAAIEKAESGGDGEAADRVRHERSAFRFEHTREMVKSYPNDYDLRFDLGYLYYEREMINEAIQQFQAAQRSPKYRLRAIYYMAMCFKHKKQYDMALEQLEAAAAEPGAMDDTRKEIIYQLGVVLSETGHPDRAMEHFKKIYQVDIGYKDVAQRIESQYKG